MNSTQKKQYSKKLACTPIGDFNDKTAKSILDAKQATEQLLLAELDKQLMLEVTSAIKFSYDKEDCYKWYGTKIRGVPIIKWNGITYLVQPLINYIFNTQINVNCKCSKKLGCCNPLHLR